MTGREADIIRGAVPDLAPAVVLPTCPPTGVVVAHLPDGRAVYVRRSDLAPAERAADSVRRAADAAPDVSGPVQRVGMDARAQRMLCGGVGVGAAAAGIGWGLGQLLAGLAVATPALVLIVVALLLRAARPADRRVTVINHSRWLGRSRTTINR